MVVVSQGAREGEKRERSFSVGVGVRGGQRMKRLEMGRVTVGSGMSGDIEGRGSEEGRGKVSR